MHAISLKGDNYNDFLFVFKHTITLPKKGLLLKDRICSRKGKNTVFSSRPIFQEANEFRQSCFPSKCIYFFQVNGYKWEERQNNFDRFGSLENISLPLKRNKYLYPASLERYYPVLSILICLLQVRGSQLLYYLIRSSPFSSLWRNKS